MAMNDEAKKLYIEYLSGENDAFAALVRLVTPRFFRMFRHLGADPGDAEDFCQEFFAALHRAGETFRREMNFMPWAYEIARNIYYKTSRKTGRIKIIPIDSWIAAQKDGFESELEISNLLSKLSDEKREVFELKHFWDMRFSEIAEILKIPVGTVKSRMFSAVDELRKILSRSGL